MHTDTAGGSEVAVAAVSKVNSKGQRGSAGGWVWVGSSAGRRGRVRALLAYLCI